MKAEQLRNYITGELVPGMEVAAHASLHICEELYHGVITRVEKKRAWFKPTHKVYRDQTITSTGLVPHTTVTVKPLENPQVWEQPFTMRKDGTWLIGPTRANFAHHNFGILRKDHPFIPELCNWYEPDVAVPIPE